MTTILLILQLMTPAQAVAAAQREAQPLIVDAQGYLRTVVEPMDCAALTSMAGMFKTLKSMREFIEDPDASVWTLECENCGGSYLGSDYTKGQRLQEQIAVLQSKIRIVNRTIDSGRRLHQTLKCMEK